jgi:hypothetical protein
VHNLFVVAGVRFVAAGAIFILRERNALPYIDDYSNLKTLAIMRVGERIALPQDKETLASSCRLF